MKYCPNCGNKLVLKQAGDDGKIPFCNNCTQYQFDKFSTCVIALTVNEYNEAVLLKQSYLSDKYCTFPAGYMQFGETAENAIIREIKEEIGLEVQSLNYVQSLWFHSKNMLMLGFIARVKKKEFILSSEVDEAKWVNIENVTNQIFPEHPDNIAYILCKKFLNQQYSAVIN